MSQVINNTKLRYNLLSAGILDRIVVLESAVIFFFHFSIVWAYLSVKGFSCVMYWRNITLLQPCSQNWENSRVWDTVWSNIYIYYTTYTCKEHVYRDSLVFQWFLQFSFFCDGMNGTHTYFLTHTHTKKKILMRLRTHHCINITVISLWLSQV